MSVAQGLGEVYASVAGVAGVHPFQAWVHLVAGRLESARCLEALKKRLVC